MKKKLLILLLLIGCQLQQGFSQKNDFDVDENMLMNTNWRYTRTTHEATGESIHTASKSYQYYLNLKFDYTYESYLNGKTSKGTWLLNDESNELYYNFRNIKWWKIVQLDEKELVLAFSIGNGVFHYSFEKVKYKDTPFQKPINELPTVNVKEKDRKGLFGRRKKDKPKKKLVRKKKKGEDLVPIEIQMIGGGFYGGLNPMIKDYVHIKTNGRCIKEQESLQDGATKDVFDIDRANLEKFVAFATSKNFFEFDRSYDCVSGDCIKRKRKKPTPIPLRLSIRHGEDYHIVIISIYGRDEEARGRQYVEYPPEIDLLVQGVRKLIERD
jgi:hypothetical protein